MHRIDALLCCSAPVKVTAWPATVVLLLTVRVVVVSADWMFWSQLLSIGVVVLVRTVVGEDLVESCIGEHP